MAESPVHLSQQSLQGAWQGTCWSGMLGSCAPAWPAFFQAWLGPSPARGYSTLQARSAFFQPQGNGSSTKVGTSFPSLPLPSRWAFQPFAAWIPPVLDRGWEQNKPDFSCPPAHLFPATDGWTICWLLIGAGTSVGGFSLYPGLARSLPTATSCLSAPSPKLRGHRMGIRKGSGCLCPTPPTVFNPPCPYTYATLWWGTAP